ncbi:PucR family transcriptional regulator [Saccharothrix variisporea]|uniref:PucR-like helix-turn-helix protein n=1 Tax=Saccharothrix variisporea TaxID=543527 RepID=A0A495XHY5_9PSEU|nr:PucR family transcriptional regulator [Saccharothrix variisporea]RKT73622.1 PucR-like helix-turn-helix protein [Saccharothrix variisporea]
MVVPLRDVVGRPELGLAVLCGADLLDRPVAWAHVSELSDPAPFLLGREFLLTAGVNFPTDVDRYVARLAERDVTALGFGVTPVHDEVPAALVTSCAARGLPLIAVPPATPFLAVSQAVGALIAEAQNAELRLLADSQRALTRAAVRPRPVEGTVRALALALDGWALLLTPAGVVAGAGAAPVPTDDLLALAGKVAAGRGPRSAATEVAGDHVVLNPVDHATVLVVGRPTPFSVADRAVVAVALGLLGLLRADPAEGRAARLATRLLLTDDRASAADPLADLVGRPPHRVVAGHGPDDHDRLTRLLGTPLVDTADDGFRAVVTGPVDLDALHRHGWLAGVSSPATAVDLPDAAREAGALLRRARAEGVSQQADTRAGVAALVDPVRARRFALALLAPLKDNRTPHLVETARTWLAHNGNWDRTAAALGVHRNSVRHRIAHVERALDLDLSRAQHRADLWCALEWLPDGWPGP